MLRSRSTIGLSAMLLLVNCVVFADLETSDPLPVLNGTGLTARAHHLPEVLGVPRDSVYQAYLEAALHMAMMSDGREIYVIGRDGNPIYFILRELGFNPRLINISKAMVDRMNNPNTPRAERDACRERIRQYLAANNLSAETLGTRRILFADMGNTGNMTNEIIEAFFPQQRSSFRRHFAVATSGVYGGEIPSSLPFHTIFSSQYSPLVANRMMNRTRELERQIPQFARRATDIREVGGVLQPVSYSNERDPEGNGERVDPAGARVFYEDLLHYLRNRNGRTIAATRRRQWSELMELFNARGATATTIHNGLSVWLARQPAESIHEALVRGFIETVNRNFADRRIELDVTRVRRGTTGPRLTRGFYPELVGTQTSSRTATELSHIARNINVFRPTQSQEEMDQRISMRLAALYELHDRFGNHPSVPRDLVTLLLDSNFTIASMAGDLLEGVTVTEGLSNLRAMASGRIHLPDHGNANPNYLERVFNILVHHASDAEILAGLRRFLIGEIDLLLPAALTRDARRLLVHELGKRIAQAPVRQLLVDMALSESSGLELRWGLPAHEIKYVREAALEVLGRRGATVEDLRIVSRVVNQRMTSNSLANYALSVLQNHLEIAVADPTILGHLAESLVLSQRRGNQSYVDTVLTMLELGAEHSADFLHVVEMELLDQRRRATQESEQQSLDHLIGRVSRSRNACEVVMRSAAAPAAVPAK